MINGVTHHHLSVFNFRASNFFVVSVLRGNFRQKSPVGTWISVRLIEVSVLRLSVLQRFFNEKDTYVLPGHVKVSVLQRCPSYGMSVLRGFTVVFIALVGVKQLFISFPLLFYHICCYFWSIFECFIKIPEYHQPGYSF